MEEIQQIQSCDDLVEKLNKKEQILHAVHVPDAKVNFENEISELDFFRTEMLQITEVFLANWVMDLPTMHGICTKLDQKIDHALSNCLSRCSSDRSGSKKLSEKDAYKFRYLLDYIAFLQDYNSLINRYLEYALGYAQSQPQSQPLFPGEAIGNSLQNPEVQGIPVDLDISSFETREQRNFNAKVLDKKKGKVEEDEVKVFRMTILKLANDYKGGLIKFLETLTRRGWYQFFAALIGTNERAVAGNVNGEMDHRHSWYNHTERAQITFDQFERRKEFRHK